MGSGIEACASASIGSDIAVGVTGVIGAGSGKRSARSH
jgi:hypothetical protein